MRVAVVAEETAHHVDTPATDRLGRLAELLGARGHDISIFCAQWWDGQPETFEADGLTYQAVTRDTAQPIRRFATHLPGLLRQFNPEIIHVAHVESLPIHTAVLTGGLTRTPVIVDWYDYTPPTNGRATARRLAARAPTTVVAPSRLVETGIRELGRTETDIDIIPTGIEMDRIRAIDPEPTADIVYSRPLDPDANLESLLLALAELRDMDWHAAIIGDGSERDRYEQQAADLRIDDRVTFLGDRPLDERLAIFKGAHVSVHTAIKAPFVTDFLRSLAAGCVGIAEYHAESSAHELIEGRDRGFRTTTEESLVEAIRESATLEHREIDEDFDRYDERAFLEAYLDIYRSHLF